MVVSREHRNCGVPPLRAASPRSRTLVSVLGFARGYADLMNLDNPSRAEIKAPLDWVRRIDGTPALTA